MMPGCVVRRPVAAQPVGGLVQAGQLAHLVGVQERQPAVDLPLVESVGAAEAFETLGAPVHPAQLGRALDELERQPAAGVEVGVERRLPAAVHRAPPVDRLHDVERHAEHVAGVVGRDQLGVRHVGAGQRAHQPDLPQQPVDAGGVGAGAGHPQHHPPASPTAALDQIERVLRAALELGQLRLFAVTRCVIGIQPAAEHARVESRFTHLSHRPRHRCTPQSPYGE